MDEHINPYEVNEFETPVIEPSGDIRNVNTDTGAIFDYAFRFWKANFLILVAATLIQIGINFGISFVGGFLKTFLAASIGANEPAVLICGILTSITTQVASIFLAIGIIRFHLQILRGGPAELSLLFSGGDRFWSVLGFSIIAGIVLVLGFLLLIIPGFLLLLMYWPAQLLIVDKRTPVFESFKLAREITQGNLLKTFVLSIFAIGISMVGLLVFCVGIIPAQSLIGLLMCTAYLAMSGQITLPDREVMH